MEFRQCEFVFFKVGFRIKKKNNKIKICVLCGELNNVAYYFQEIYLYVPTHLLSFSNQGKQSLLPAMLFFFYANLLKGRQSLKNFDILF